MLFKFYSKTKFRGPYWSNAWKAKAFQVQFNSKTEHEEAYSSIAWNSTAFQMQYLLVYFCTKTTLEDTYFNQFSKQKTPYKCNNCWANFASKQGMNIYLEYVHDGQKPFKCINVILSLLLSFHANKKACKCNICDANFSSKHKMNSHIQSVHGTYKVSFPHVQQKYASSNNCLVENMLHNFDICKASSLHVQQKYGPSNDCFTTF